MADAKPVSLLTNARLVLRGSAPYFWTAALFGTVLSALSLGVPVAVQVLIDSVTNLGDIQPVLILSLVLLLVLAAAGTLAALQNFTLEMFERHFFARTAQEASMRAAYAESLSFERQNREDLYNRFFDIEAVKTHVPILLSTGLNLVLQAVVGYLVVSFYHPYFLIVSVLHALLVVLIWKSVDRSAVASAIELSSSKYDMGHWLESVAIKHRLFKSRQGIEWAVERTDELTEQYIAAHKRHFRASFTQTVSYQVLMAVGSALLLGVGGWLVVIGQLTVGQLVAAELILGTIFLNTGGFASVLESYYSLAAALDKLGKLYQISIEDLETQGFDEPWDASVQLENIRVGFRRHELRLEAEFPAGSATLVAPESLSVSEVFCDLLFRVQEPLQGRVLLGGRDIEVFDIHWLREAVSIIGDTRLLSCTIADFMRLGNPGLTRGQMHQYLDAVDLESVVEELELGLDEPLSPQGMPLTTSEVLRLKIAHTLAQQPRVLVFTSICDLLRLEQRQRILEFVRSRGDCTFICLSNRHDIEGFDRYMRLGSGYSETFEDLRGLLVAEGDFELAARHPRGDGS